MESLYVALVIILGLTAALLLFRQVTQQRDFARLRRRSARLDELAGFGQAILNAQLKLDALAEVVYQQASHLIDTTNFQLGLFEEADYVIMIWVRDGERLPSQRFPRAAEEGLIGWVHRTGQALLVRDFEREWESLPARPSYQASHPYRSGLYVPLLTGGVSIGVIAVQNTQPNIYDDNDLRLLTVLTNQAAGAIRNAQLFEQAQARNRQLRLVSEVSQQVSAIQPLPNLFRQIVTLIQQTFGYYVVNLFTINEKEKTIRLQASTHPDLPENKLVLPIGTGLVGWVAERATTAIVADVTRDHRYYDDGILTETRAELAVPLIVERRVVGALDVQSDRANAFDHEDVVMLETLASQVALAIQEAETYAAERRQRERLNALTEASRAVVSILNIEDLLDEVIDLLTDYFGYDRTHIFLLEDNQIIFRAGSGVHSGRWAIEQLTYHIDDPGMIARSIRTRQPILSNNVTLTPEYIPGPGVEDTRSEMVIPIRMGLQTLGALDIQSTDLGAFTPDDAALAEALADTMAVALRNAALYAREKRRRILAESLREVSMGLGASLEVDRVLDGILDGLARVIAVQAAMIVLYDDDNAAYHVSAVHGELDEVALFGRTIPAGPAVEQAIIALFHPDSEDTTHHQAGHTLLPLTFGDAPIGFLAVDKTGTLSNDDREVLAAFATQSAMAIANAQLYMAQREEAWVSTALLQVAEATARATTLDEVLQTVTRITPLLVGVEWCSVLLSEGSAFRIVEIEGLDPALDQLYIGHTLSPEEWPPLQSMLAERAPVSLDQMEPPRFMAETAEAPPPARIQRGVMLPLFTKGDIVGAMVIGQLESSEPFSRRKLEMVGGIANQAALAIESAQLYAAQQEEAWVTTALLQVAEAVNAQVDIVSTLQTIVRLTPLLVGVTHCIVLRWDAEQAVFCEAVSYGLTADAENALSAMIFPPEQHPFFAALLNAGTPLETGPKTPYELTGLLQRAMDTPAVLGLPLITQGKLVGVMLVNNPDHIARADQRRTNILTGIAYQTAIAIETNQLQAAASDRQRLERELEVAQNIQTSFLPECNPTVSGWDVASYYRAARMVGGDFYDFLALPGGKWGLVVADVADKGMPAALYMALCRTLLRAVARNRDNPAQTLLRVNRLLLEDTRSDLFVTVWYAIWDPKTGSFAYSSAGHNPPLVIRQHGAAVQPLKLKGIALGVLTDITLNTGHVTLEPGDTLVMYTDGVTEAQNANGQQFTVSGLETAVRAHHGDTAQVMINTVIDALDIHTGNEPQFDDLTLVIVRREP